MIVSNRLLVGCERRTSGASRHQLEAMKRIGRTRESNASIRKMSNFMLRRVATCGIDGLWCCLRKQPSPKPPLMPRFAVLQLQTRCPSILKSSSDKGGSLPWSPQQ